MPCHRRCAHTLPQRSNRSDDDDDGVNAHERRPLLLQHNRDEVAGAVHEDGDGGHGDTITRRLRALEARDAAMAAARSAALWDNTPPPHIACAEEQQTGVLTRLLFCWMSGVVEAATRGTLTRDGLAPPTARWRSYHTSRAVAAHMQRELHRRRCWEVYVGCTVTLCGADARVARGRLCWVGALPQSRYPHALVAGVQWCNTLPRRHGHGDDTSVHDGTLYGERLFAPHEHGEGSRRAAPAPAAAAAAAVVAATTTAIAAMCTCEPLARMRLVVTPRQHDSDDDDHAASASAATAAPPSRTSTPSAAVAAGPAAAGECIVRPPLPVRPPNLLYALLRAHPRLLLTQLPLRLLNDVTTLLLPVVLSHYIAYLDVANVKSDSDTQQPHSSTAPFASSSGGVTAATTPTWRRGLVLVAALMLLRIVDTCAAQAYAHLCMRGVAVYQSATTALVFAKCLTVQRAALLLPDMSPGRVVNMVSQDAATVGAMHWYAAHVISAPLQLCVAAWLLFRLVGTSACAGAVVLAVTLPLQGSLTRRQHRLQHALAAMTDRRLRQTRELLSSMQTVKHMQYEAVLLARIEHTRAAELRCLRRLQLNIIAFMAVNAAAPMLVLAAVIACYHASGHVLTPAVLFPCIVLLQTIRVPLYLCSILLAMYTQLRVSCRRLTLFLECADAQSPVRDVAALTRRPRTRQGEHTQQSDAATKAESAALATDNTTWTRGVAEAAVVMCHADIGALAPQPVPACRLRPRRVWRRVVDVFTPRIAPESEYGPLARGDNDDSSETHNSDSHGGGVVDSGASVSEAAGVPCSDDKSMMTSKSTCKTTANKDDSSNCSSNSNNNNSSDSSRRGERRPRRRDVVAANNAAAAGTADATHYTLVPRTLLRDVTLSIPRGRLTLVVGATGAGKSVLLQAILGQFEVTRGHIWASRSIAYVPQQAWIMNATLRNNILFFKDEQPDALREALRVSQLDMDLKLLTSGLETEIGEKGINLSGGQRARVSLARAVYADRDMYILDDPLSALDAHVGERVMAECILGKLAGKTRVLATHHLHVLGSADYVIAVGDGGVLYAGDSAAFAQTAAYRAISAATEESAATAGADGGGSSGNDAVTATEPTATATTTTSSDGSSGSSGSGSSGSGGDAAVHKTDAEDAKAAPRSRPQSSAKAEAGADAGARLIVEEEKASGSVPLSTYITYFQYCGGTRTLLRLAACLLMTECLAALSPLWLALWSADALHASLSVYFRVYLLLVCVSVCVLPLRASVAYADMLRASRNVHRALLASVATGTMNFFDTTPLGRIVNRFSRDVDVMDTSLNGDFLYLCIFCCSIASSCTLIVVSQPVVLCVLVPCAVVYYHLIVMYNAAVREVRRLRSVTMTPLLTLLTDVLQDNSLAVLRNHTRAVMREALRRIDTVYAGVYTEGMLLRWLTIRVDLMNTLIVCCLALLGVVSRQMQHTRTASSLVSLSLTMALQTTSQLNWLVRQAAATEADMNSVERALHYIHNIEREDMPEMDKEVDVLLRKLGVDGDAGGGAAAAGDASATAVTVEARDAADAPRRGEAADVAAGSLEFRHVSMRYRAGLPLVLRDVSFAIRPGEKVGVVGRTGSGKSTLLLTFLRMVDVCGGEIVVSGRPAQSYSLRALRRLFSMIPQDPVLFDGTVRLNVDPFLQATATEVWGALDVVGLRSRIEAESEGIDSRVQEGGSNFSVGQRQLLCMARALLKRGSQFILMDEATANVDPNLDAYIQRTVMRAFAQYTVITIAHRLHTVASYDKIIVMDRGVVAEMGATRELATRPGSLFRGMVEALGKREYRRFLAAVDEAAQSPTGDTNGHAE